MTRDAVCNPVHTSVFDCGQALTVPNNFSPPPSVLRVARQTHGLRADGHGQWLGHRGVSGRDGGDAGLRLAAVEPVLGHEARRQPRPGRKVGDRSLRCPEVAVAGSGPRGEGGRGCGGGGTPPPPDTRELRATSDSSQEFGPGGRRGGAAQPLADQLCGWRFKLWLRSGGSLAALETKALS